MSGGGAVALGSSVTLNNAGVTSLAGTANVITASAATGAVTLNVGNNVLTNGNAIGTTIVVAANAVNLTQAQCTGTAGAPADPTVPVTNATTAMAVVASPAGILNTGWTNYLWFGYVKSAGVVALHICSTQNVVTTAAQTFNIRLVN
jgi:hypothetical protein